MDSNQRLVDLLGKQRSGLTRFINSLIFKYLRSECSAEEILGEAIAYALKNPEMMESRSDENLLIFLRWKAKLIVLDRARNVKAATRAIQKRADQIVNESDDASQRYSSPSFVLHKQEKREAVAQLLKQLPDDARREALWLVFIEGHSFGKAAVALGKTRDQIRSLVRSALGQLVHTGRSLGVDRFITTGETS